jgi:hypothetical protein
MHEFRQIYSNAIFGTKDRKWGKPNTTSSRTGHIFVLQWFVNIYTKLIKFYEFFKPKIEKSNFFRKKMFNYFFSVWAFFNTYIHLKIPNRLCYIRKSAFFMHNRWARKFVMMIFCMKLDFFTSKNYFLPEYLGKWDKHSSFNEKKLL